MAFKRLAKTLNCILLMSSFGWGVACDPFPVRYDVRAMGNPKDLYPLDEDYLLTTKKNIDLALLGPSVLISNIGPWKYPENGTFPTFEVQITNRQDVPVWISRESFLLRYGQNKILGSMDRKESQTKIFPGETKKIIVSFKDENFPTLNEHPDDILPLAFELHAIIFENSMEKTVVFESQWEVWRYF